MTSSCPNKKKNVPICEARNTMRPIISACDIKLLKNYKLVHAVKMKPRVTTFCLR